MDIQQNENQQIIKRAKIIGEELQASAEEQLTQAEHKSARSKIRHQFDRFYNAIHKADLNEVINLLTQIVKLIETITKHNSS